MKNTFENIVNKLSQKIPSLQYNMFIKDLILINSSDHKLDIGTTSIFKKSWIDEHYLKFMNEIAAEIIKKPVKINIIVDKKNNTDNISKSPLKTNHAISSNDKIDNNFISDNNTNLNKSFTFENFIVGLDNKIPYEIAKKTANNPGKINPLFIYGKVGIGKTHIMQSIGNYIKDKSAHLQILYVTSATFVEDFISSLQNKTDHRFRLKYKNLDIFLLDDVQFFINKHSCEKELFNIFNELYLKGKQMVFCSDRTPSELDSIDDRLKSRLGSSVIVEIEPPQYETKIMIIDAYCKQNNFILDKDIIYFLAEKLPADVRIIKGAIDQLIITSDITEITIDNNFIKKFLKEHLKQFSQKVFTPEKILLSAANFFSISLNDLRSGKRSKNIAYARQITMYLLKVHTKLSLNDIGNNLGGKQHSTIIHGIHNIEKQIEKNPDLSKTLSNILSIIE